MTSFDILIGLAGEVALLLWGIHMVSSGVQRALGANLRRFLAVGLRNRLRAMLVGVGVTGLLQSSTATALMVASFSAGGSVELVPALAVMLGANVGTTLIVQVVSFNGSIISSFLLFAGVVLFRRGRLSILRDVGSAMVGLGLMLLALHLLARTVEPVEASVAMRGLLAAITRDPFLNIVLAALFSWAAHSSVAAMLFIMSLAGADVVSPGAALAMVLGANLGSALNPLVGGLGRDTARLRVPLGNLLNRVVGCVLALPLLPSLSEGLAKLGQSPARAAADFHLAFNLVLALAFVALLPAVAALLKRLLPEAPRAENPAEPLYLEQAALMTPTVAVVNASREALRLADIVGAMLRGCRQTFHGNDREAIAAVAKLDDTVDALYSAIQHYLGAISYDALNPDEARRVAEILALVINLEHVGDIIDKNLMELAAKRLNNHLVLSPSQLAALDDMHARLLDHLQLAIAVFMSGDADAARRLVAEKEQFRDIERDTTARHLAMMRSGRRENIEASALQLDITRDLKRIEAHIAATAYGLLEQSGQLRTSRLKADAATSTRMAPSNA